jgi:hypothetical protein
MAGCTFGNVIQTIWLSEECATTCTIHQGTYDCGSNVPIRTVERLFAVAYDSQERTGVLGRGRSHTRHSLGGELARAGSKAMPG